MTEQKQQRRTIFDVLEAQLDAIDAATASARATLTLLRDQAARAQQPAERLKPRTFGDRAPQERVS